jgi:SAM-dependent methyltransferase
LLIARGGAGFVQGIDPSAEQLAFARARFEPRVAQFGQGDAMSLPLPDDAFDAAVMPLVIFFVPDPARGVAEMARVVRPGGLVGAYAWDMVGGGFPYQALQDEMRGLGAKVGAPPSVDASRIEVMGELWRGAGLEGVETRAISVRRTFEDFEDYWETVRRGPSVGPGLAAMAAGDVEVLRERLRARLGADGEGRITCGARANTVRGRVAAGG